MDEGTFGVKQPPNLPNIFIGQALCWEDGDQHMRENLPIVKHATWDWFTSSHLSILNVA